MRRRKRALIAITDPAVYERLEELLELADVEIGRALDRETALALGFRQSFAVVVSDLPLRGASLRDFLGNLTGTSSLSPGAPVVLYGLAPGANLFHGAGSVSQCASIRELLSATARSLGVGNRVARRLLVQLELEVESAAVRRAMQTENLSVSGMLLRTQRLLPVGSVIPFVLDLPLDPEPVEGHAEVVRHADPAREGLVGMGVRFVDVDEATGERLASFVASARSTSRPALTV